MIINKNGYHGKLVKGNDYIERYLISPVFFKSLVNHNTVGLLVFVLVLRERERAHASSCARGWGRGRGRGRANPKQAPWSVQSPIS